MEYEKNGEKKRRLDLSVAQVSGSAVAAVVAAKLASTLGVYGTILGAGVISVIATCGGSVFQHLFKRTGEQIREVAVHAEPSKSANASNASKALAPPTHLPASDRTQVLTTVGGPLAPSGGERVGEEFGEKFGEKFGEATTHGTRVRGWKRSGVAAALVFLVAMGGITAYELISDQDFSGTKGTTTFGSVVRGGDAGEHTPSNAPTPTKRPDTEQQGSATSPSPDAGRSTPDPTPTPSPSQSTDGSPSPTPTPTPSTQTPTPAPPPTATPSTEAPLQDAAPAE
ncbi:hypothetical protein [Streptomyces sp. NPDC046712]|uniref:hypothetical protein n=1 Tax=Streptomyces sp. NPDC046712 TaxID=3154802 RepID=UPI0033EFF1AF